MNPATNLLAPEHCACLDQVLNETPGHLAVIQALEECGVPCEEFKAALLAQQDMAAKLKAKFFQYQP